MIIKHNKQIKTGYLPITEIDKLHPEFLLDFGLLRLEKNKEFISDEPKERAYLLMKGVIELSWDNEKRKVQRNSCFDESPTVLHIPQNKKIRIVCLSQTAELAVEKCLNNRVFPPKLYLPEDCDSQEFGKGTMKEASTRTVRTVFDGERAPWSNMVMGEVITHPGKWSSYPPHDHPHPEIYHYRFKPEQGFGASFLDYEAYTVRDGDTCLIPPDTTHSQVAAAGYAMWYVWMIPHLENNVWKPETRYFRDEHKWLLDKNAAIWEGK